MLRLLILILYSTICSGLSKSNTPEGRIVKGYKVEVYRYPHAGFMHFKKYIPTACGSSLFTVQAVITAAHCLDEIHYHEGEINVFFGASIPLNAEIVRKVASFVIHPKFKPERGRYNIGIAFLNEPLPLSDYVSKIPIATKVPLPDDALFTSGWGKQEPGKLPDYSDLRHLKASKQKVISSRDCEKHTGFRMSSAYWCTVSINGYHYHGDAGDGLVTQDNFLVGVVSYMINEVTIYSDVTRELEWITKSTKKLYKEYCKSIGKKKEKHVLY